MTDESTQVIGWNVNDVAIAEAAEQCKGIDAYENLPAAKEAKKHLTKMRTRLAEAHKETKAEALAFGRKVDAEKNRLLGLIKEIEDPISEQLDEIKNAAAKAEEERLQKIMKYIEGIQAFALDRHSLTIEELQARREELQSRGLDPEITQELHADAQLSFDEADLKLRLAIDAEKTRLEDERKRAELEEENRILKEQREEFERDKRELEEEKRAEEEKRRLEQQKEDRERQEELDRQQAEIERQNKEREDEEIRIQIEANERDAIEEAQRIRDMQAPDVVKLEKYCEAINHLIGLKPVMGSTAGNAVLLDVVHGLVGVHTLLTNNIEEMK